MLDIALIEECADPSLTPAIVQQFVTVAGSKNPLAVTVTSGQRLILVRQPKTPEEAMEIVRQQVRHSVVRVGVTQYPAGIGVEDPSELKPDLVDACENLRVGTRMFAKVMRIVTKWYGNPTGDEPFRQIFDDAIHAWKTGWFEGTAVFREADPNEAIMARPAPAETSSEDAATQKGLREAEEVLGDQSADDPGRAAMRIDLSRIGSR